jgi:lipopolysaccharide/colanic/teichoic acid biosynthesis glycosyltransferase
MRTKRVIDVVAGSILAVLVAPVVLVLAVGCAISLRCSPFFVQRRVGRDGREFPLPKLRTLPRTTPVDADKYALTGTPIPRFCALLRRVHLDELPQLFVVPIGWMSLVGPRPEMPGQLQRYPSDFVAVRTTVRPGCTGLWQVSRAAGMMIFESPEYDIAYVRHGGIRLDVWIIVHTLRLCATGSPSLGLEDVPRWAWARSARGAVGPLTGTPVPVIDLRDPVPAPVSLDLVAIERAEAPRSIAATAESGPDQLRGRLP